MTGRVFILGSGFSKAVYCGMPTMAELSDAVVGELRASKLPMPPGFDKPVSADFERWLSYLVDSPPWLEAGQQERNHASFSEVADAVSATLTAVQIKAAVNPQPAWLPRLVTHWQDTDAAVITFNYDVLVELAWLDLYGVPDRCVTRLVLPDQVDSERVGVGKKRRVGQQREQLVSVIAGVLQVRDSERDFLTGGAGEKGADVSNLR